MKAKTTALTLTVNPQECTIHPAGKHHVRRQSQRGYVKFKATAPCTILFTNPSVFGKQFIKLARGDNKRFIKVERGHTLVMIAGCVYKIPRSLGAASNPIDIIVP